MVTSSMPAMCHTTAASGRSSITKFVDYAKSGSLGMVETQKQSTCLHHAGRTAYKSDCINEGTAKWSSLCRPTRHPMHGRTRIIHNLRRAINKASLIRNKYGHMDRKIKSICQHLVVNLSSVCPPTAVIWYLSTAHNPFLWCIWLIDCLSSGSNIMNPSPRALPNAPSTLSRRQRWYILDAQCDHLVFCARHSQDETLKSAYHGACLHTVQCTARQKIASGRGDPGHCDCCICHSSLPRRFLHSTRRHAKKSRGKKKRKNEERTTE